MISPASQLGAVSLIVLELISDLGMIIENANIPYIDAICIPVLLMKLLSDL